MKFILTLALMAVSGLANAQSVGQCTLDTTTADLAFEAVGQSSLQQSDYGMIQVQCDAGMPWSLELQNAGPGGVIKLNGLRPGNSIDAHLTEVATNQAIGQATYGEAFTGTGTGSAQTVSVRASVNMPVVPAADTYKDTAQVVLSF